MLRRMERPTVPRRRLAPITATRGRLQQVPHAGNVRAALPDGHRFQVVIEALVGLAAREREGQLHHAVGALPLHRQAGIGEDPEHRGVIRERLRGEELQLPAPGDRYQVLKQQGGHPPAVHRVRDGEGDLSGAFLARGLVACDTDQRPLLPRQQCRVVGTRRPADALRLLLGSARAEAEESQVHVVRGHRRVHVAHRINVARSGRADLDGAAVGEQRVGRGGRRRGGQGHCHCSGSVSRSRPAGCPPGTTRAY